jgi:CBS domain containing-hemolysin-like protein
VNLHGHANVGDMLSPDEITIIRGVLDMASKKVKSCFIKMEHVFYLHSNTIITSDLIREIISVGHSRIPILDSTDNVVIGVLYAKSLIFMNPLVSEKMGAFFPPNCTVAQLMKDTLLYISQEMGLYDLLNKFQEGKSW